MADAPQPGLFGCVCDAETAVCVDCTGAGDAHASVLPHASMLENPEKVAAGGAAAGVGAALGAAGCDRLNAEFKGGEAIA